jgi:hypothetical protein
MVAAARADGWRSVVVAAATSVAGAMLISNKLVPLAATLLALLAVHLLFFEAVAP